MWGQDSWCFLPNNRHLITACATTTNFSLLRLCVDHLAERWPDVFAFIFIITYLCLPFSITWISAFLPVLMFPSESWRFLALPYLLVILVVFKLLIQSQIVLTSLRLRVVFWIRKNCDFFYILFQIKYKISQPHNVCLLVSDYKSMQVSADVWTDCSFICS